VRPAGWPRAEARLLRLDTGSERLADHGLPELPSLLRRGDLLVVNDAATLPASLFANSRFGTIELRLCGPAGERGTWPAVAFGDGDWRQRTEDRPAPPPLHKGDGVEFAQGLRAVVEGVSDRSPRLLELRFLCERDAFWRLLYAAGRPVQYSHLVGPLSLWHVQTPFAARPWAVEMPSASRGIGTRLLQALGESGIGVAAVTHAAGLSATGDPLLDAALPLPERYEVGEATRRAVDATRSRGGRVVAAGTSVVRALESSARDGASAGSTDLRIAPDTELRVVDGLLTGIHEPGTSHFELTRAFASAPLLDAARQHAERSGYLGHEFGDYALLLAA
jgi:S-adenosylmethionine:tRNA ribosyltransferase-isomerase